MAMATALVMVLAAAVALAATHAGSPGWGMMGGRHVYRPANPSPVPVHTLAGARTEAQKFADRLGLRVDEVLQFKRNFYAKLVDSNGNGATEVLVDPASGVVWTEYGPAMMWNTKYRMHAAGGGMMGGSGYGGMMGGSGYGGMMGGSGYGGMMGNSGYGGMMGGYAPGGSSSGSVSFSRAHKLAQNWLNAHRPGVKVETGGDTFPGYYTLETLKDGKITGMISVHARTGAVWFHTWHGAFVAKSE